MQSRVLLQLFIIVCQQVSFSNTPLITPDTCSSFSSAWVYSNPGKTAAWLINRSIYSLTCVVASTEGVKFRVLCEEPGTALHLLMEVKACLCVLSVSPCAESWPVLVMNCSEAGCVSLPRSTLSGAAPCFRPTASPLTAATPKTPGQLWSRSCLLGSWFTPGGTKPPRVTEGSRKIRRAKGKWLNLWWNAVHRWTSQSSTRWACVFQHSHHTDVPSTPDKKTAEIPSNFNTKPPTKPPTPLQQQKWIGDVRINPFPSEGWTLLCWFLLPLSFISF